MLLVKNKSKYFVIKLHQADIYSFNNCYSYRIADNSVNNNFGDLLNSIGMAMITLLYGYMIGNMVESCWPEEEQASLSPTFVRFFVCGMMG